MSTLNVVANVIVEYGKGPVPPDGEKTGGSTFLVRKNVEVEVLTVHFEKRTMRVRFVINNYGKNKITTTDIPADPFFLKYGELLNDSRAIKVDVPILYEVMLSLYRAGRKDGQPIYDDMDSEEIEYAMHRALDGKISDKHLDNFEEFISGLPNFMTSCYE